MRLKVQSYERLVASVHCPHVLALMRFLPSGFLRPRVLLLLWCVLGMVHRPSPANREKRRLYARKHGLLLPKPAGLSNVLVPLEPSK